MARPAAGDRAPDAPLVAAKGGASLRLYDLFAEHRHVLLLLGDGPEAPRPRRPLCLAFRKASSQRIAAPGTSGGDYVDREGVIAQRYGSTPTAYLIRPHGYVGFRATGARFPRTYPTTSPSSFRRLAPVERAGSAPGPDAESDDLFDCSGTGARRCAIEGPVTTSKSLRDIGLTSCEREAAPHSATFG
jgi:hypothetical protein